MTRRRYSGGLRSQDVGALDVPSSNSRSRLKTTSRTTKTESCRAGSPRGYNVAKCGYGSGINRHALRLVRLMHGGPWETSEDKRGPCDTFGRQSPTQLRKLSWSRGLRLPGTFAQTGYD